MKKITQNAVNAFFARSNWCQGNTMISSDSNATQMFLHGNLIAEQRHTEGAPIVVTLAGWPTVTTRERLTGLLMAHNGTYVAQRNFKQVLGNINEGSLTEKEIGTHEFVEVQ